MSAVAIDEKTRLTADEGRAELRRMIKEGGQVEEARALSKRLAVWYPDDEAVQYWAWVLQPPRVIGTLPGSGRGHAETNTWLREHSREHRGQWVAVRAGVLLAAEPDRETLFERLRTRSDGDVGAVVMYIQP